MAFVPPVGMPVFQAPAAPYMDAVQHHYQAHAVALPEGAYYTTVLPPQISCDIKPRLTKEQHDILEAHFQKQNKPNTNTKKGFADALNVSLDKVNNWFQNRRAKSKQDAKKANAMNMFPQATNNNADNSPAFPRSDYLNMMQQCASDDQHSSGLGLGSMPPYQNARQAPAAMFTPSAQSGPFASLQIPDAGSATFNSMQEMNRRTLTQEQFNALGHNGNMLPPSGQLQTFSQDFAGAPDLLDPVFADMMNTDEKHENFYAFSMPYGDGPSSVDSSVPSVASEHSLFPPGTFSDSTNLSASPDDWTESRSASIPASTASESQLQLSQMASATQQTSSTSSQWQPGQSKPVELESLQQQFRDAQTLQQTMQAQAQAQSLAEEPLAWPEDVFTVPDSQSSNQLTQQMSDFALQTPQPPMPAHFKAPPPASSIAARRHVKRPAALGIASLRSTSYSGGPGPASPGQGIKSSQQPLRRIQSSVAMNSIAQGRVTKGSISSAQRSPLNFTFSESVNSPKAMRHASSSSAIGGSLAPPTPLSPTEMTLGDQARPQFTSPWPSQRMSSRNTSVSEVDFEHPVPYFPPSSATSQTFSSPPHTPMFNHQFHPFMNGHIAPHMMLENTPPQSAPASQLCFSSNVFSMPQQMMAMPPPPPPQMVPLQATSGQQTVASFVDSALPANMAPVQPGQAFMMPSNGQQAEVSIQHALSTAASVPDLRGRNASVASAPDMQQPSLVVQSSDLTDASASILEQSLYLPPQSELSEFNFEFATDPSSSAPQASQSETELSVHEYNPPEDIKQAPTSRKHFISGPKNWTFANQGPEHYEKEKNQKGSVSSSSPESHISPQ